MTGRTDGRVDRPRRRFPPLLMLRYGARLGGCTPRKTTPTAVEVLGCCFFLVYVFFFFFVRLRNKVAVITSASFAFPLPCFLSCGRMRRFD